MRKDVCLLRGDLPLHGHIRQVLPHFFIQLLIPAHRPASYFRNFRFPQQGGADDPGVVAQLGLDDPGAFVPVAGDALLLHQPPQGQQQLLVALVADAAADGQRIRLEDVHHVGDSRRQIADVLVADALAHGIALPCGDKG